MRNNYAKLLLKNIFIHIRNEEHYVYRRAVIQPLLLLVFIGSVTSSCTYNSNANSPNVNIDIVNQIFFPKQNLRNGLTAKLVGQLLLVDQCLRVQSDNSDTSFLIIWPPDYSLSVDGDTIAVLDNEAKIVAQVDEKVTLAGGAFGESGESLEISQELPATCPGPYWQVGTQVP